MLGIDSKEDKYVKFHHRMQQVFSDNVIGTLTGKAKNRKSRKMNDSRFQSGDETNVKKMSLVAIA